MVRDPNKGSMARNEGVFRKLPSQLHSHLCSDRISFDFPNLQQLTMRSNRGDACLLPRPFLLLANFFFFFSFLFFFFRQFSIFRSCFSNGNDHSYHEILKKFRRSKTARVCRLDAMSVQKSSILTRYYVDNVVRNIYID